MKGKIFRIDNCKSSRNEGELYTRVHFEIDGPTVRYAHTDIVPTYKNYKNWEDLLEKGNVLGNLTEWKEGKINADSRPVLISKEEKKEFVSQRIEKVETMKLI
jgi:hypothetical protein